MSFDRRAATMLWSIVAVALGFSAATSEIDAPAEPIDHDPVAYRTLVELLDASETGEWLVEFAFTRTPHDGVRPTAAVTHEARLPGVHVLRLPTSAIAEIGDAKLSCTVAGAAVSCIERDVGSTLTTAETIAVLVEEHVYVVAELPDEPIAGEKARCFQVFGRAGFEPSFGLEREYCFGADAVPLRVRVVDANTTDERVAVAVQRDPGDAAVEALLSDLERAAGDFDG